MGLMKTNKTFRRLTVKHTIFLIAGLLLALTPPAFAMTSANFSLSGDLNSGGGTRSSAGYTMFEDALGIGGGGTSSSPQYALQSGSIYVLADLYAPDTIPDLFEFMDQANVPLGTLVTSNSITVTGINAATPVNVMGGTYDINGSGIWSSASGTVNEGDAVRVSQTSSLAYSTTTTAVLVIGGVPGSFNVTTIAGAMYVMIPGTLPSYYSTLQSAFNAAADGQTLMAQAMEFDEALVLSTPVSLILSGGYDGSFSTSTGITTIKGSLAIDSGKLTIGTGAFSIY